MYLSTVSITKETRNKNIYLATVNVTKETKHVLDNSQWHQGNDTTKHPLCNHQRHQGSETTQTHAWQKSLWPVVTLTNKRTKLVVLTQTVVLDQKRSHLTDVTNFGNTYKKQRYYYSCLWYFYALFVCLSCSFLLCLWLLWLLPNLTLNIVKQPFRALV